MVPEEEDGHHVLEIKSLRKRRGYIFLIEDDNCGMREDGNISNTSPCTKGPARRVPVVFPGHRTTHAQLWQRNQDTNLAR
jgi:hypothetical protein